MEENCDNIITGVRENFAWKQGLSSVNFCNEISPRIDRYIYTYSRNNEIFPMKTDLPRDNPLKRSSVPFGDRKFLDQASVTLSLLFVRPSKGTSQPCSFRSTPDGGGRGSERESAAPRFETRSFCGRLDKRGYPETRLFRHAMRRECCLRNAVSLSSLKRAKRRSFLSSVLETNLLAANQIFPQ